MSTVSQDKSVLTPAAFLIRGLAVGLVAGLLAFVVAFALGEPTIDDAIALEDAAAAQMTPQEVAAEEAAAAEEDHSGMVAVSRDNQKSWGLLTGTVVVGAALGGLTALAAAAVIGRLGNLSARGSTALVALLGFVSIVLVPFAKYPSTPPAVGDGETIGGRTASYFALVLISVLAVIAAVVIANKLRARVDGWTATGIVAAGYIAVVAVAAALLPSVNELGDFPADLLWYFRRSSLLTLMTLWAAIGVGLVALLGRLHDTATADANRRELAANL
ncbi:hypothetical protein ASE01_21525 [Nocardioides sp. Root190]|uniref:CbtA family protein n=1 Tax=Nocardioides sp. Root190 TaxID=1736488 RepID=UPI0006F856A7|nr:CbtA family protein [Nocardioides sp. Root190]KRB73318.1 hypothetical protein ASE01_21525 [Nocardioides sp. Root190]